jgi:polyisoprenoid-binding protein YceI
MSWKIDNAHSEINFSVRHMMISTVRGRFEKFTGTVDFNEKEPTLSTVDVKIEAASVNTKDEKRDAHLRSPDFFNADVYPYLTFKHKRIVVVDDHHGRIIGDLTIRDVTHEVTLDVTFNGKATSPWGNESAGFSATAKINRKDWNLSWNMPLESGGWLVDDNININIEVEIIKQPETIPA